jgi:hypothetical protein
MADGGGLFSGSELNCKDRRGGTRPKRPGHVQIDPRLNSLAIRGWLGPDYNGRNRPGVFFPPGPRDVGSPILSNSE